MNVDSQDSINISYDMDICSQNPDVIWNDKGTLHLLLDDKKPCNERTQTNDLQMFLERQAGLMPIRNIHENDTEQLKMLSSVFEKMTKQKEGRLIDIEEEMKDDDSFTLLSQNYRTPDIQRTKPARKITSTPYTSSNNSASPLFSPIKQPSKRINCTIDEDKEMACSEIPILSSAPTVRRSLIKVQSFEDQKQPTPRKINRTKSFSDSQMGKCSQNVLPCSQSITRIFKHQRINSNVKPPSKSNNVNVKLVLPSQIPPQKIYTTKSEENLAKERNINCNYDRRIPGTIKNNLIWPVKGKGDSGNADTITRRFTVPLKRHAPTTVANMNSESQILLTDNMKELIEKKRLKALEKRRKILQKQTNVV